MPSIAATLEPDDGTSQRDRAERALEAAILSGALAPDSRLALPALSSRFNAGITPLREALSHLAARGLVTLAENKGFRVAHISYEDLVDITQSRILLEKAAMERAFSGKDHEWEDRLVSATHRLVRIVRNSKTRLLEGSAEYDAAHKAFHAAIIAGCGLRRVMELQSSLYDAAYRYRRILSDGMLTRDHVIEIHQRLSKLVLARDPAALAELERHLMTTIEIVYGAYRKGDA
jgi:GntR family carbon starvation induced transcriptional regulator